MGGLLPTQDFVFFADESGTSGDRFTVVGGLCVHKNTIPSVHRSIEEYRNKHNMHSELKWTKISNQKQEEYIKLVEYFFALNSTNHIQFHAVIFDSHQWNHAKYNNGDRDVGLSKLYYQLLLHKFAKTCGGTGSLCACLDHRNSSTSLEEMRKMLNSTLASKHDMPSNPLKQLVSADSKLEDLLQLNDVILGAVNAVRNGKHLLADTRQSKKVVAQMVLEKSGLAGFDVDSPKSVNRFSLWNMVPRSK